MFTLIVTVLAVIAVLGFLLRITDSVIADSGTRPRKSTASEGRRAANALCPTADSRGIR
jgi:hypothetical protein